MKLEFGCAEGDSKSSHCSTSIFVISFAEVVKKNLSYGVVTRATIERELFAIVNGNY